MKNRLIQLFAQNQARQPVRPVAGAKDTIYLYDVIGGDWYGGIDARQFADDLAAIEGDTVHLRVDSPGGDVFEAAAMAAQLDASGKKVIAYVDGLAASAASKLIMHADEIVIGASAFVMIHNAWTLAYGNKADFRKQADILDKIDETLVATYVGKTGATAQQVRAWMDAETWFNADEAVEHGFATSKAEKVAKQAAWNLAAYDNPPKALTEPPTPIFPQLDRAALERRVALLSRIAV